MDHFIYKDRYYTKIPLLFFCLFFFVFEVKSDEIKSPTFLPDLKHWSLNSVVSYENEKLEYDKANTQDYEEQKREGAKVVLDTIYRINRPLAFNLEVGRYPFHRAHKRFGDNNPSFTKKGTGFTPFKMGLIWRLEEEFLGGPERDFLFFYTAKMPKDSLPYGHRNANDFYMAFRFSMADIFFDASGLFYARLTYKADNYKLEDNQSLRSEDYSSYGAKFNAQYLFYSPLAASLLVGVNRDSNHEVWNKLSEGRSTNGWGYIIGAGTILIVDKKTKLSFHFSKEEGYYILTINSKRDKIEGERNTYSLSLLHEF